jgi:hypothetical protein
MSPPDLVRTRGRALKYSIDSFGIQGSWALWFASSEFEVFAKPLGGYVRNGGFAAS